MDRKMPLPPDSDGRGWMPVVGFAAVAAFGAAALLSFVLAMHCFPGGYNPFMRMLSALGRTEVRIVEYPWSHYLFVAGMFFSVLAVVSASLCAGLSRWGAALNVAGLLLIALVPEDVSMVLHPFAPLVPSLQKIVILAFAAWLLFLSAKGAGRASRIVGAVFLCVPVLVSAFLFLRPNGHSVADLLKDAPPDAADAPRALPLSEDELAALAWLERVTGPLGAEEEREWWDIGGTQHGIFAKRYNIAFAGYAAAAIGMRGDGGGEAPVSVSADSEDEQKKRDRRIKTLHSLIVFYSFLVPERVHSFDEILAVIDKNDNNMRIARHLGFGKGLLERYRNKVGWQTLQKLDYKIQNLDRLANETQDIDLGDEYRDTPEAVKKTIVAMRKFGRLGEAKIVTPPNIAYDMVRQIPDAELKSLVESGQKILDLAAKIGEFAIAIVRRCAEPDVNLTPETLKDAILAIPMCGVTYEFTRKVYELLGLDVKCIAQPKNMTTYDLLTIREGAASSALQGKGRDSLRPLDYARIKRLLTQNKDFNTITIGDVSPKENRPCA